MRKPSFKKLRLLRRILKETKADKIVSGFVLFWLASALIIVLVEPDINHYGDALWYCYAVVSTVGFGDVVITTHIGRIVSVILTIYSLFVVAIVTGVVVSFYTNAVSISLKDSKEALLDKLERLPELSKDELKELSEKVKHI